MDGYLIVKTLHIISSTLLFGTGLGTAFLFWNAHRSADRSRRLFAARATIAADWLFTTPAVLVQPLTGAWLVWRAGFDWTDFWLVATYALYLVAGACWIPVVILQLRMLAMLDGRRPLDSVHYERMRRAWFCLGWPAFAGLVAIFWLMVAKPPW